ncbi:aspartate carbamoyltransferase catalytic subunit [Oceanicola sp. 502str15]|uniref:aspartate carbamoyltransferase catalytic subunit n=1 Tax=Oceanicola sp. 502str15 TaxID=2696061 RepID=UPI0020943D3E|nr:aspartate carbamoyltransferase catalytic subunit [Oceanicola sp. 502str15]MCO6384216.1 aspartate carbamoyltransferase catalytic subunit [Oceanicola sp. 502str15]
MPKAPPGWAGLLDDDEEILWQGRASGAITFRGRDIFQSLFGLFFAGFAIFWISMASSMGPPRNAPAIFHFFPLFGLPFLAIGLHLAFGKYFWDAYVRRHTNYTLTNQRGFIATEVFGNRKLKSYPLTDNLVLEQSARGDTLWFASENFTRRNKNGLKRTYTRRIGFELIEDGAQVMGLARKALKEHAK